jgi:hypothetical protein
MWSSTFIPPTQFPWYITSVPSNNALILCLSTDIKIYQLSDIGNKKAAVIKCHNYEHMIINPQVLGSYLHHRPILPVLCSLP